jgi:hypothetical protein
MSKSDRLPAALQSSLTHFQIAWLRTQAQAMNISSEELSKRIITEWLSNHPELLQGRGDAREIIRRALSDFIQRHSAEFLPVSDA